MMCACDDGSTNWWERLEKYRLKKGKKNQINDGQRLPRTKELL